MHNLVCRNSVNQSMYFLHQKHSRLGNGYGRAMVLGNFQYPPTNLVGQGLTVLAIGAGGFVSIFFLVNNSSFLPPFVWADGSI